MAVRQLVDSTPDRVAGFGHAGPARGTDMTKRSRRIDGCAETRRRTEAEGGEEPLMVLQHLVDLLLDLGSQTVEISRPLMTATNALHHDDGEASYDEHAPVVMTLRTHDRERGVRIRHGRGADRSAELEDGARAGSVIGSNT